MKNKMQHRIIQFFLVMIGLASTASFASDFLSVKGYPAPAGTAPRKLALATVKEIKDSVLTVKIYNTEHVVMTDNKTRLTRNGKPAALADIKAGMKVSITFIERSGHKVATIIDIRTDAKPVKSPEPKPATADRQPEPQ